ncbi:MAG: hypothetical protein QM498_08785 [Desulfobacterium sp.]
MASQLLNRSLVCPPVVFRSAEKISWGKRSAMAAARSLLAAFKQ